MLMSDPQRALITVMMLVAACDDELSDAELQTITANVRYLPVFTGFDPERLPGIAQDFARAVEKEEGLETMIDSIGRALPERLRETAYALAVEVAAADHHPSQEALRLLEIIGERLHVDPLAAAAIERGARARHVLA
jgi:tellurite resistance protein